MENIILDGKATSKNITEAANSIYKDFQELLKVTKEAIK